MTKSIAIDEEGYFVLQNGVRLTEEETGRAMLKSLAIDEVGVVTLSYQGESALVEPFDKVYVAQQIHFENNLWQIQLPYQLRLDIDIQSLNLDEWDRIHGFTTNGFPFVLSRKAQAELFNLAENFSDDSITVNGLEIKTEDYFVSSDHTDKLDFWSEKYNTHAPWNLDEPHPELKSILPQLKLSKSRILVPGCGYGHDAAYLAEQGHIVTAFDFSEEAIKGAKKKYGHIKNLTFEVADAFNLDQSYFNAFEIVFEHTFYCAITPQKRNDIIKLWKRCLAETGHLLGVFFVMPKRTGPPFGGSEWELRDKLEKDFNFLYWTRLKYSPGWRKGAELMVYAQIKPQP
ncbi:MAG: methyltransferase domain-containing protein [Bdellovibrionales bacterium]|nr:TPMT family class I SAM-dependent methyltransferase [Bdellovibrionales bacterium]NQZ19603.1 methyltransferase domain-containing protein [Bdellovibrionales bacterium]